MKKFRVLYFFGAATIPGCYLLFTLSCTFYRSSNCRLSHTSPLRQIEHFQERKCDIYPVYKLAPAGFPKHLHLSARERFFKNRNINMGTTQTSHCCDNDPFRGSQEPTLLSPWLLVITSHNLPHLPFTFTQTVLFITEFLYSHHIPNEKQVH